MASHTAARQTGPRAKRQTTSRRSTQPRTVVEQAQGLAERAVLVPIGAGLLARETLVSGGRELAARYRTPASVQHELRRLQRQVRRTRTRFERQVRQRRTVVRRTIGERAEKLASGVSDRIGSTS